jgi:hypothetical protein
MNAAFVQANFWDRGRLARKRVAASVLIGATQASCWVGIPELILRGGSAWRKFVRASRSFAGGTPTVPEARLNVCGIRSNDSGRVVAGTTSSLFEVHRLRRSRSGMIIAQELGVITA